LTKPINTASHTFNDGRDSPAGLSAVGPGAEPVSQEPVCQDPVFQDGVPFWQRKTLDDMTASEWESLCDGCGRCCLLKLEDEDTADIHLTRLSCKLLDVSTCRCKDYPKRHVQVPDCVAINPAKVRELSWLPPTCGYRLIEAGAPLQWWHPLVSGSPDTVHQAGISVRGWALSETRVKPEHIHRYIIRDFHPTQP
jgi:uncharacterized protein